MSLSWIDKIFVINLERSKERLENCIQQSKIYHFSFERFHAIEGNKLSRKQKKFVHPLCANLLCTYGMMGCGLSHLFLWKKMVKENIQTAMILEDDFVWREDSSEKINQLKDFHDGIVKLSCIGPFCGDEVLSNQKPIICPFAIGNGAYLLRLEQVKSLLKHIENVFYHIDVQMSMVSKNMNIPIYYFDCIDVDGTLDSTLGVKIQNSTLLSKMIPLSDNIKWMMNEPFIAPLKKPVHSFLLLSLLLIGTGLLIWRINMYVGLFFIILGLIDIFYFLLN
jgi:GR25 family glycosyltransferase involved in LPS biosynthesis